ncbi:hypothetical protein K474DRAFT_1709981 [Panus rudis PR-1116 ss-1]|nr:hypothetical protein K474DRAFT_1709981 [Panus rudis PR-1116 ss-1]
MVSTREANARTHPGQVQLYAMQTRRPTAIVQAERQQKQAKKAAKEAEDAAKEAKQVEDTKGLRSMETRMWQDEAEHAQSAVAPLTRGRGRSGTTALHGGATVRGRRGGATGGRGGATGGRGGATGGRSGRGGRGGHGGKGTSDDLLDDINNGDSHGRDSAPTKVKGHRGRRGRGQADTRGRGRGRVDNTVTHEVPTIVEASPASKVVRGRGRGGHGSGRGHIVQTATKAGAVQTSNEGDEEAMDADNGMPLKTSHANFKIPLPYEWPPSTIPERSLHDEEDLGEEEDLEEEDEPMALDGEEEGSGNQEYGYADEEYQVEDEEGFEQEEEGELENDVENIVARYADDAPDAIVEGQSESDVFGVDSMQSSMAGQQRSVDEQLELSAVRGGVQDGRPSASPTKRKEGSTSAVGPAAKKVKSLPQGLKPGWLGTPTPKGRYPSNNPVPSPVQPPPMQVNEYGGIADEDDALEYRQTSTQHAPTAQSNTMVAIEYNKPALKLEEQDTDEANQRGYNRKRPTTDNVVKILGKAATEKWKDLLMATYISFIGSREGPFTILKDVVYTEFNKMLAKTYPQQAGALSHQEREELFGVAYQRKSEWFNALAGHGLRVVINYFKANTQKFPNTPARVEHAKDLLGAVAQRGDTICFVWEEWTLDPDSEDMSEPVFTTRGLFLNPLVLRSFLYFLQCTEASVIQYGHPRGGLLLSILAIERALSIFVTNEGGPIPAKGLMEFSDIGMKTWMSYYQEGIRSLDNMQWKKILAAAKAQNTSPLANATTPVAPRKLKPLFEASASART